MHTYNANIRKIQEEFYAVRFFKVWSTGDLISASDFNDYIMEQVIMTFANATARDSAVSSPEEGMFCFLKDTNVLQFYNGSSCFLY